MKTPIQKLITSFDLYGETQLTGFEVIEILKKELTEEKSQIVRAFNNGMRDTNDNGYDYFNEWYNESV